MDSDIPPQSVRRKSRLGDLHLAFVMDKGAVEGHAQWWNPKMREKIDTQRRMDPGASIMAGGGGPKLSAWVAEERNHISEQESTEREERIFANLAHKAKVRGLDARERFRFSPTEKSGTQGANLVDTRWVLTWKEFDSGKTVKARLVARG